MCSAEQGHFMRPTLLRTLLLHVFLKSFFVFLFDFFYKN